MSRTQPRAKYRGPCPAAANKATELQIEHRIRRAHPELDSGAPFYLRIFNWG